MCTDDTEAIDDISVFDENFEDPNWGLRQTDDPLCYSNEAIKNFLNNLKPNLHMYINEQSINLSNPEEPQTFHKFSQPLSLSLSYNNYFYSNLNLSPNTIEF